MQTIVVQGASRGLGLEMTRQWIERGDRVFATCRAPDGASALQRLTARSGGRLSVVQLDVSDEESIRVAADEVRARTDHVDILINVAGILHGPGGIPERRVDDLDAEHLLRSFAVNTVGPALMARHFRRLLQHGDRAVWATLSARVGSIADNRLGGWYGYRSSKAAQNMITKNLSIELPRHNPRLVVVALHPGTVDTDLSRPFSNRIKHEVFGVQRGAAQLIAIVDGLQERDNGRFIAWDGTDIPW